MKKNKKRKPSKNHYKKKNKYNNEKTTNNYDKVDIICFICNKPISNTHDIVNNKEEKKAHFNCVIKDLSKKENLKKNQSIIYIGGGNFAIVEYYNKNLYDFKIVKKINYENRNDYYCNNNQE